MAVIWWILIAIVLLFLLLTVSFKIYIKFTTGVYYGKERLDGKTVIITGASAGIGAETAKDLANRGARVVMLCRDTLKGDSVRQDIVSATGNKNIGIKYVDFTSLASVRKCANDLLCEEERIDILVNNAGASYVTIDEVTEDGLNLLMQTNYFGSFLLTNILLDKIKQSAPSRIVNVASYMHRFATLDLTDLEQKNVKSKEKHYSNTKLANIYFTNVLAERLQGTGVTANSLHPGVIATEITRNYSKFIQILNALILNVLFKSIWEGAQTTIYLCVSPNVANVSGKYFSDCHETPISEAAKDMTQATKLWELSEKAVMLQDNDKVAKFKRSNA